MKISLGHGRIDKMPKQASLQRFLEDGWMDGWIDERAGGWVGTKSGARDCLAHKKDQSLENLGADY